MAGRTPPSAPPEPSAEELAAAIHETTNALTVILGWIERARIATPGNHEAARALTRAGRYTRDARACMRRAIGAELPPMPPERAASIAERAAEDLAIEAARAEVELALEVDEHSGDPLVAHPDTAWQILTNLLLNAIAVTPSGGTVELTVMRTKHEIVFVVEDDGPGVPDELQEELFKSGVTRRAGGAGIGLRHAHQLAVDCGGRLSLRVDAGSREGARFELRWPVLGDRTTTPATEPDRPRDGRRSDLEGARVLLLEDDARVIELLELSLGARGAAVTSVRSADELTDKLDSERYDVMLVDLSPLSIEAGEPRGLDAAVAKARDNNPGIDVVVISGSVTVRPRDDVIWLRKPFEPKELVQAILRGAPGETR